MCECVCDLTKPFAYQSAVKLSIQLRNDAESWGAIAIDGVVEYLFSYS